MLNTEYVINFQNNTSNSLENELLSKLQKYGVYRISFTGYKSSIICEVIISLGNICGHNKVEFKISKSSITMDGVLAVGTKYIEDNQQRLRKNALSVFTQQSEFYNQIVEYFANKNKAIVNNNRFIIIEDKIKQFCDNLANNYQEKNEMKDLDKMTATEFEAFISANCKIYHSNNKKMKSKAAIK